MTYAERTRASKTALPPGSVIHIGRKIVEQTSVRVIQYDNESIDLLGAVSLEEIKARKDEPRSLWVTVTGLHDVELITEVGKIFGLHPLVLEDIVNTGQRPKFEDFHDYFFMVLKILSIDTETGELDSEQVSLICGSNYVISFLEGGYDPFPPIIKRVESGHGRVRNSGADYLAYALVDAVVDSYFEDLEAAADRLETLEEDLLDQPDSESIQVTYQFKRSVIAMRRAVWPLREAVGSMIRGESDLISDNTMIYLRDVYDHIIQVIESTEALRETISGMHEIYLSSVSNRMNQVMKVLTIIATMFIPLTFLAGVYGMNFKYMPELDWPWAYPTLLGIMAAIVVVMLIYFRRKDWI